MPKKTANSRSGAQRSRPRQKSFELVRPVSDENVLETVESNEETEIVASGVVEMGEVETKNIQEKIPVAATVSADGPPRSVATRMAARRMAAQKAPRTPANTIAAENYGYVRKDLVFILILAIIMFSAIIIMHFVPAIGG